MKNIETNDGITWKQLNNLNLTAAQREILKDKESQAAKDLVVELSANRYTVLSTEQSATAIAKYDEVKPELKESDNYQLIAVNMTLTDEDTVYAGIVNYRINGVHKQIRF